MDYKEKYEKVLEKAKAFLKRWECVEEANSSLVLKEVKDIFPELKESEDEKIRKGLIENFKWFCGDFPETTKWGKDDDMLVKDIITWLEKQGEKTHQTPQWMINFLNENRAKFASSMDDYDEQREAGGKLDAIINWLKKQGGCVADCPQNHQESSRPNGCIVLEDFNGGEGFYKLHLDYLNKKQVEEVEEMIRVWNKESQGKSALEAIKEEKVDNANRVGPKFKVGDWVVYDHRTYQVVELPKEGYINLGLRRNGKIEFAPSTYCRLWTIQDTKLGDVLVCDGKYGQEIGIVKKYIGKFGGCDKCFETYCFVDWDGIFRVGEYMGSQNIHPATKEQRDILFARMREAEYEWDAKDKELKKIETKGGEK